MLEQVEDATGVSMADSPTAGWDMHDLTAQPTAQTLALKMSLSVTPLPTPGPSLIPPILALGHAPSISPSFISFSPWPQVPPPRTPNSFPVS